MSGDPAHPAAGDLWRRTSNHFHTCPLRKAGEGTMIDLSHLTEEEQAMIMTVLKRDAELKKAEEERVRKLEDIVNNTSQSDAKLKYLTGEWFYEAKSRRHRDKIHGSEIILASMKQGKAASLDGSLRLDRPKVASSRASDIVPPLKPARQLEAEQPQQISDAEKENQSSGIRSPRMPRHNPFNRASLVVVEPPENNHYLSASRDQESLETEPVSPLKNHPAGEANQTSEGSSVGFRPVPKKRTFLSRRPLSPSESNGLGLDAQPGSAGIIPTPRRRLQRGSSGSSNQSGLKSQDEMPQRSAVSNQVARSSTSADENSLQSLCDNSQVSSNSSLERQRNPASITRDRVSRYTRSDASTETGPSQRSEERDDQPQRELPPLNFVTLPTTNIQDKENNSRVGPAMRQEELSLPQNIVDPDLPVSYDLNFVDKSHQQTQRSNHANVFKLSTQATSPTGEDEESIAKVLEWFSRSTDSSDWLNSDDPVVTKSPDKHVEVSRLRAEDLLSKDAVDMISDRKKETLETKRNHLQRQINNDKELRAADRRGSKEVIESQEEVKTGTRERMHSQDVKDDADESQPPKISHLKSFWEKSNTGPKILIGKSVSSGDKGQKSAQLTTEKRSDMALVPGIYSGNEIYDKYASNPSDEREQQLLITTDVGESVHLNNHQQADNLVINLPQEGNDDSTYKSDYLMLLSSERRGSDAEVFCTTRAPARTGISPESESIFLIKPDSFSEPREVLLPEELSKSLPVSQLDTDLLTRASLDSEKLCLTRNNVYMDYKQPGNDVQITTKAQIQRGSGEDKSIHSSMSPKRKEDSSNKDRTNSPHLNRQALQNQESTAERIKQLKSFWEQERNKPMFYTGKPRAFGDGKVARGANQAKLNKRFTKSEYDLRSIGNESGSDDENYDKNHQNFSIMPLNQRIDKLSPSLGTSRAQFNTLREFWDEATSDSKGSFSFDKPKSPKRKEGISAQLSSQDVKVVDPEIYRLSSAVEKTRPAVMKSSPPPLNRSKSPHDRQTGSGSRALGDGKNNPPNYNSTESGQQRLSRKSSKDSSREEKTSKPQNSSGKESRIPKSRKDSFGCSSSRGNSMRRATSMFALSIPDEKDQSKLKMDVSPVHSQSRKQRQNPEKAIVPRRSEETEALTPRARAFVPRDYRHYLGMTDKTSVHTSLAPAVKDEGSEGKSGYELDLTGPVRASTPVSSEERYSRKVNKMSQRPLWANYSSSDTGQESSVSSTSETWSNSRNSSNRENDDCDQNPVRKALRRAEARPKNLAKSMEDITASLSPRQERRQDSTSDLRRVNDASVIASPSSALFSDPDHLKKMSKSVPSFLQKELSGSVMTMYSADFANVEVQGSIQFSINYVQRLREFHIFVAECRDLAAVDPKRGRSDPYVKSYLAPDKANLGKRKTSVKKKTLNPTFNEILRYRVRMEYLRTQTLILSVWHHDTFGKNSFLGEVDVELSKWDFDHTQMNYLALKARTTPTLAPSNDRGEMKLAIRFLPQIIHSEGVAKDSCSTGEIHIWVKECKNLPLIRATIDPYVKCFVLPDTSRKSRQKTRVLRRTVDPVFNHTMVYDGIREADLTEACVELTVWDRDRLASNLLGGLRLGTGTGRSYGAVVDWMDSSPYEVALWERMMATPNEWVEAVLPLRMLNSAKTAFK
ncbi:synaptotagmin-like protein 2 isoform X4 [Astatotilapia calliptera]|uniref:synaptotagmin-like protein 2 isoform X4 n=1 Tax=Astatotilapia calliptera TaxID=8154 RepID=UPI000E41E827|nr:synaptotagmin-like protein 2 isoform X4 [Astatotilapia calliptera]